MRAIVRRIALMIFRVLYDKKYIRGKQFVSLGGVKNCYKFWFAQKIKGYNRHCPFPVNPTTTVGNINNLHFNVDDLDNFWKVGCYYQCWRGHIYIGKGTYIAQNVGIITENHNPYNLDDHFPAKDVQIGEKCWIGMNSVILPGVTLGNRTVVGAGSVVTHSCPEGNCIIAGVPAKIIKRLDDNLYEHNKESDK